MTRTRIRSLVVAIFAVLTVALMAIMPSIAPQVVLAATALIMGGAGHSLATPPDTLPFVQRYTKVGVEQYITPALGQAPDEVVVVVTPEARILGFGFDPAFTFRGIFDGPFDKAVAEGQQSLHGCITGGSECVYNPAASTEEPTPEDTFIVYGYSQSSAIATLEKRVLIDEDPTGSTHHVMFLLTANGNRPNGGILSRGPEGLTVPIIGLTFNGSTPTNNANPDAYPTIDIARQYDGWADQPTNPLNLLAEVNVLFGMLYLHQNYDDVSLQDGEFQDRVGDTAYFLVPTPILPLLLPIDGIPVIGHPLADTLDPVLRVLIEAGYDRTISPGTPTQWNPLYFPDPVKLMTNLAEAVPTGLDNGIEDVTDHRPFGTQRPGPYGVGGPPVQVDPSKPTELPTFPPTVEPASAQPDPAIAAATPPAETEKPAATEEPVTEQPPVTPVKTVLPRFNRHLVGHGLRGTGDDSTAADETAGPTTRTPKVRPHEAIESRLDAIRESVQSAVKKPADPEPASTTTN